MNNLTGSEAVEPISTSPVNRQEWLAAWLQFPRRVIILLIAYSLALGLIGNIPTLLLGADPELMIADDLSVPINPDESISLRQGAPVAELIGERLPNTLSLLGAALVLALFLALITSLIGAAIDRLEAQVGLPGRVVKWLGRIAIFGGAVAPVFVLGIMLIFIFAVRLDLLPTSGMMGLGGAGGQADRLRHLLLPALTLALFPAVLTAQTISRQMALRREQGRSLLWPAALLTGLGSLLTQTGGIFSAASLVETIFNWPGIGQMVIQAAMFRDYPVLVGVLSSGASLILGGRLAAELFYGVERMLSQRQPSMAVSSALQPKRSRLIWLIVTLALLLFPLGLIAGGLSSDPEAALNTNLQARNAPPSAEHSLGTDEMGRDLQARLLQGSLVTLTNTGRTAMIVFLLALSIGLLAGLLASRRRLWAESGADLMLLPADILLFIPLIPGLIAIISLIGSGESTLLSFSALAVIFLIPRVVRIGQAAWQTILEQGVNPPLILIVLGGLLFASLFAAFGLITSLDFLGLGTAPPTPSLGSVFAGSFAYLNVSSNAALTTSLIIWAVALVFFLISDALMSFIRSGEALVRLNE
jgi:peptide/nickel transport system permease protein